MGRIYNYKLTVNIPYWTAQLAKIGKTLTAKDKRLLNSVKYEKQDNEAMARIHAKALTNGLYIPCLTDLVGDCMFESIEKTGFCEDRREFRKSVALLMFLFGDCKIISTYDDTLKNIFNMFNEIEYVFCHKMKRVYKYTYYTMCTDMFSDGSWSRLPTEIVLTLISIFFKVRINIYHDNGHINKICDEAVDKALPLDDPSCNINLALIGENHYVPLVPVPHKDTVSLKCPKYTIKLKKFLKWAQEKADVIGLYEDVDDDMDSAISDSDSDSDSESDKDHKESQQDDDSSHSTSSSNGSRSKSSGSNTASPRSKLMTDNDDSQSDTGSDQSSSTSSKGKKVLKSVNIEEDLDIKFGTPKSIAPLIVPSPTTVTQTSTTSESNVHIKKKRPDNSDTKPKKTGPTVVVEKDLLFFV